MSASHNEYHKPQLSLNHQWQINEKSSLSTAAYVSIGRGYGNAGQGYKKDANGTTYRNMWYGSYKGNLNTYFRNSDGTFAYDQIYDMNEASDNGSMMAMSKVSTNTTGMACCLHIRQNLVITLIFTEV